MATELQTKRPLPWLVLLLRSLPGTIARARVHAHAAKLAQALDRTLAIPIPVALDHHGKAAPPDPRHVLTAMPRHGCLSATAAKLLHALLPGHGCTSVSVQPAASY